MIVHTSEPLFDFRVIVAYDEAYSIWVARCLETGSVVSAESAAVASDMIRELLQDELAYNLNHNNLGNLFDCPAQASSWSAYHRCPGERHRIAWRVKWPEAGFEYGAVVVIATEPQPIAILTNTNETLANQRMTNGG